MLVLIIIMIIMKIGLTDKTIVMIAGDNWWWLMIDDSDNDAI